MNPTTTPNAFAAAIIAFLGSILAAIDPSGVLGGRWSPVIVSGAAIVVLFIAARQTVPKAVHQTQVAQARKLERLTVVDEINKLAFQPPPPQPAKARPVRKAAAKTSR